MPRCLRAVVPPAAVVQALEQALRVTRQEVPLPFGGKMELLADVENVLNLINKDWGTIQQVGFPYTSSVVNVSCLQAATPTGTAGTASTSASTPCAQYRYSSFRAPNEATNINGSLWGVRFGIRLAF